MEGVLWTFPTEWFQFTTSFELFPKRLENEKLKEENEVIKSQIENLKVLQNDYNNKLDQAAENIEIAKLNLGPSREEYIALEGEVKRIRKCYEYLIKSSMFEFGHSM